ncbi:MAG: sugar phosphate isomerase/epimerase [Candidatus Bathyarchaeota archaeon]|nr:sugar phosphate isomerase/epimerase [Candidatus Bathyarchaeota archaeon]
MPIAENLRSVQRLGFLNVEFNMKSVEENDDDSVYTVKELIETCGLRCLTLHAASLHMSSTAELQKACYYVKVSAEFAKTLGVPLMVVHSNVSRKIPEKIRRQLLKEFFSFLKPYAKKLGIKLALENLSYASSGYGKNVAELEEIFGLINHDDSIGFTLDFCHAEATGQTFPLLEKYKNRLCNVHLSNRAHKPFLQEDPHLIAFLKRLQEFNYHGSLTLELNRKCSFEEVLATKNIVEKLLL